MKQILKLPYRVLRPFYELTPFHRNVIEEITDPLMKQAYTHCREITRYHARTFYMATRFLPTEKQRGIFAIYAICRYLDDLVDESEDLLARRQIKREEVDRKLEGFRSGLLRHYTGSIREDPVLTAFADVLHRYAIPVGLPLELMKGVRMDLFKFRYRNFDELYDYSYKVASTVGLMTSEVFGYQNPEALRHAVDLGIAMQLTNILRDVGEDLRKGRIYLPTDELELFDIDESQLFDAQLDKNFVQLYRFQIARARRYYASADKGVPMLSPDSRIPVMMARENYSSILNKIEQNGYQVFNERAFLNTTEKLSILPRLYWQTRRPVHVSAT